MAAMPTLYGRSSTIYDLAPRSRDHVERDCSILMLGATREFGVERGNFRTRQLSFLFT
jgi:hypothetical protein